MDDEKYMLRRAVKGHLVKLDADIFYRLLERNFYIKYTRGSPKAVRFWEKDVQCSVRRLTYLSRFIMNAGKDEIIDHTNRDIFDNRKSNLRFVNLRQNGLNQVRKNKKIPFFGVYLLRKGKYQCLEALYLKPERKFANLTCKLSVLGLFLAAIAHDKFIIENNEEDYAPLNFLMFKIPAFKNVLLATDIKLLRSIYLGRKNKNSEKTAEKTRPEKKNTVYKNQFFFNFRV